MKYPNHKKFVHSKTGVKVYLKTEYHPILKETDLLHPDIARKTRELFDRRYEIVKGFPKMCSENSEDAQTGGRFSPLLSMSPKKRGDWLRIFLEESLKRNLTQNLVRMLPKAELTFWRGRKEDPMYSPPPNLGCAEGNTEVDLTILAEKAIIFIEAKYRSEIAPRTTHCPYRDQIIRNIDVGTYYAWNRKLDFYFILLISSNCAKSRERLEYYLDTPQNIADRLPHRMDIPNQLEQIKDNLGLITWDQLEKIELRVT